MCRFISYFGSESILINELLEKKENSLIKQSRHAHYSKIGINADGFGVGWFDLSIDSTPGVYKSTQPAWNDGNLKHLIRKVQSECFFGHVRASTVGDVSFANCHPFIINNYMFVHNGTIKGFERIKQQIIPLIDQDIFTQIKGSTDSEHFFALLLTYLNQMNRSDKEGLIEAFTSAVKTIASLQTEEEHTRINACISDGQSLLATRYSSKELLIPSHSLFLAHAFIDNGLKVQKIGIPFEEEYNAIVIASEPLNEDLSCWKQIPPTHYMYASKIDKKVVYELSPLENFSNFTK